VVRDPMIPVAMRAYHREYLQRKRYQSQGVRNVENIAFKRIEMRFGGCIKREKFSRCAGGAGLRNENMNV
jgi:hypothetical protein